ncbi:hypothetical protein AAFF_G00399240 [Aldrovandia affinis]|uniref:Uncharacterized protein n=1 Tax=Aldrovandia affinis TaxID=143900 RepID=A0AAD7WKQ1_9TELE|nr:hypothetical protein AAFF_G00399240 [Aldrovandia affinis]
MVPSPADASECQDFNSLLGQEIHSLEGVSWKTYSMGARQGSGLGAPGEAMFMGHLPSMLGFMNRGPELWAGCVPKVGLMARGAGRSRSSVAVDKFARSDWRYGTPAPARHVLGAASPRDTVRARDTCISTLRRAPCHNNERSRTITVTVGDEDGGAPLCIAAGYAAVKQPLWPSESSVLQLASINMLRQSQGTSGASSRYSTVPVEDLAARQAACRYNVAVAGMRVGMSVRPSLPVADG